MVEPAKKAATTLSLPDKLVAVKRMLEGVLAEFDVTYEWSRQTSHILSVEIWVRNKRLTHTYTHGDYQSGLNSRADLRRKLMSVNAPMKKLALPVTPAEVIGVPLSIPMRVDKPHRTELLSTAAIVTSKPTTPMINTAPNFVTPETIKSEQLPEAPMPHEPDEVAPTTVDEPRAEPEAPAVFPPPAQPQPVSLDSRVLYHSTMLAPSEVMVIEINRDLMVAKGGVLVIPLHDPSLFLDMPKTQFQALFRQVERQIEPPPPAPPPKVRPKPAVKAEIIENPPVSATPIPQPVTPSHPPVAKTPVVAPEEPIDLEIRSVDGISSQIARHMAAIAHAQQVNNSKAVSVRDLADLLDERDYKQVSARMPRAWKLGFADRYEGSGGHSLQYGITDTGRKLLARLHTWPWLREGLPVPKWANI